jgi:hypothetical protein
LLGIAALTITGTLSSTLAAATPGRRKAIQSQYRAPVSMRV